ncbi:MAG: DUF975 family protein [Lachnospiraceae bacterium]|nr:DUF975 family protein [Lachnospiraceae bacterium]
MHQSQYKSNSELKYLARMQTGRYMGILAGTILLNLVITLVAANIFSSLVPVTTAVGYIINYILVFAVQVVTSVLNVGLSFIFLKSACNMQSTISDLFCGFRKNTSKALKLSAIIAVVESICMIPLDIASVQLTDVLESVNLNDLSLMLAGGSLDSYEILESYNVFYNAMMKFYLIMLVCTVISVILTLPFFPAFYMILDFPSWSAGTILKKSFEIMSGNKLRLFMLYLSFLHLYLLSIFTCGIALIWVIPYMKMAETNFYLDMMAVRNKTINSCV